jgi:predicted alpha/beta hydrolase family esterase
MTDTTVVLVPGLRGHVEDHWQTRLAAILPNARTVRPLGRDEPDLTARVSLLDQIVEDVDGPVVIVAHSAGVLVTVHWAATYEGTSVVGALLATPPAFAADLPPEYPSVSQLRHNGWLPVPRRPLPFPSILATSTDDALGNPVRLRAMANAWGSREHSLGAVGHLNPASGFGEWAGATSLIEELTAGIRSELVPVSPR